MICSMTDMEEKQKIHIKILDRVYPLSVTPSIESSVRNAVDRINERARRIQKTYANRDDQDALSIALLEMAVGQYDLEQETLRIGDLASRMEILDSQLDQYITNTCNKA